jgi:hypothetical protein
MLTAGVEWTDKQLDGLRAVGDPPADAVVAGLFAHDEVDAVNTMLGSMRATDDPRAAGLPAPLADFMDANAALPPWTDLDALHRAQDLFQLWGLQISLCLFCASLPSAYAAANGVKVLYRTARLDTDTRRRIMETGQFLMDVMNPGSFDPGGDAIRSIQRVRLMHAGIRHLIKARAEATLGTWDPTWGEPLNQEDLGGTLMSFAYVVGEPLPRLGVSLEPRDVNDYIHAWNVIGHLLGVHDEMLPTDLNDARLLVTTIRRRQFARSPEGLEMTDALVKFLEGSAPTIGPLHVVPAMIRHLIGPQTADLVGVGKTHAELWRISSPLRRVIDWCESWIAHDRLLQRFAEPIARELLHGAFNHERGGVRAACSIPEALARQWEMPPLPVERPQA